ncbi:MAG: hypothetical protein ACK46X_18485 [Candidatus Sericytochromatia bacterium]
MRREPRVRIELKHLFCPVLVVLVVRAHTPVMLVQEYKLSGKPEQFARVDEAIRTMQFVRNKALRFWMDHPGVGKYDLNVLSRTLAEEFTFVKKLSAQARQAACERAWTSSDGRESSPVRCAARP